MKLEVAKKNIILNRVDILGCNNFERKCCLGQFWGAMRFSWKVEEIWKRLIVIQFLEMKIASNWVEWYIVAGKKVCINHITQFHFFLYQEFYTNPSLYICIFSIKTFIYSFTLQLIKNHLKINIHNLFSSPLPLLGLRSLLAQASLSIPLSSFLCSVRAG